MTDESLTRSNVIGDGTDSTNCCKFGPVVMEELRECDDDADMRFDIYLSVRKESKAAITCKHL